MAAITAELALEISKFQASLKQAQDSLRGFKTRTEQTGGGLGEALFAGIGKGVAGLGVILAGGAVAAGVGKAVSSAIARSVQDEQTQISFEVLVGDTDKAKATIESLRQLGAETPFEFPELADAGRKLIAFGEDADNVTSTLRRIGDVASGVSAPISEIAEIYGKARVQNQLFAEDIHQLTGRGIPIIQEFARIMGQPESAVKKLASEGQITFPMLEQAFIHLTASGGKFAGMMAKQSQTVGGLWSTMKDEIGTVLLAFGQPVNDAIRPMLAKAISMVGILKEAAANIGTAIAHGMNVIVAAFQELSLADLGKLAGDALSFGFKESINVLYKGLVAAFFAAVQMFVEDIKNVIALLGVIKTAQFWQGLGNTLLGIAREFGAVLLEFIAQAIEGLKELPGASAILGDSNTLLRDIAREARAMADSNLSAGKDQLAPALDVAQKRIAETFANVGEVFARNFDKATTLFDVSGESSRIAAAAKQINDRAKANEAKARADEEARKLHGAPTTDTAPMAEAGKTRATPGLFASAVNLIMGRSANELILDESKKQTAKLESIDQKLGDLNKKLDKPAPSPRAVTAAPVMPFDMTARFA